MASKCQKWHLIFIKYHKIVLELKTPKSSIFIAKIGILNARNKALKTPKKKLFKFSFFGVSNAKMHPPEFEGTTLVPEF